MNLNYKNDINEEQKCYYILITCKIKKKNRHIELPFFFGK